MPSVELSETPRNVEGIVTSTPNGTAAAVSATFGAPVRRRRRNVVAPLFESTSKVDVSSVRPNSLAVEDTPDVDASMDYILLN